jgi:hypothetical protein
MSCCLNMQIRVACVALAGLLTAGCATEQPKKTGTMAGGPLWGASSQGRNAPPAQIDPTKIKSRDDIVRIHQFFPNYPWLVDAEGRIIGFQVSVYFISAESQKGAFVPGQIMVWLYQIKRSAAGSARELVYGWEFNSADAAGYRIRKQAVTGYYYGFPLKWPAQVDLTGREIEIVFGYERQDGNLIQGSPKRFKVPSTGYQPTPPPAQPPPRPARPAAPDQQPPDSRAVTPRAGEPEIRRIE